MANITRGGCVRKAWKPRSLRPILIYFEFRSKPSLITVICTNPHYLLRQNSVFSHSERISVSFSRLFHYISFFFFFCYFTLLLIFTKIIFLLLLFYYIFFFSWKLFLFFHVLECSGMFHVPGFIDALFFLLIFLSSAVVCRSSLAWKTLKLWKTPNRE